MAGAKDACSNARKMCSGQTYELKGEVEPPWRRSVQCDSKRGFPKTGDRAPGIARGVNAYLEPLSE